MRAWSIATRLAPTSATCQLYPVAAQRHGLVRTPPDIAMARFLAGTSGWNYSGWRGSFYPEGLPARQFLSFYASRFETTEVNYSFYHLPRVSTYEKWKAETPDGFVFALKASRFISHVKRLGHVREPWAEFVRRARALGDKLGPILLQLPPNFHATEENRRRLARLFSYRISSAQGMRLAVEFRHESCFEEPMLSLLRAHRVALVIAHSSRYPVPEAVSTAPFVYFRFHGPKELFASGYSDVELERWASHAKRFLDQGLDVYAYFNNDAMGDAVPDAQTLIRMVGHRGG